MVPARRNRKSRRVRCYAAHGHSGWLPACRCSLVAAPPQHVSGAASLFIGPTSLRDFAQANTRRRVPSQPTDTPQDSPSDVMPLEEYQQHITQLLSDGLITIDEAHDLAYQARFTTRRHLFTERAARVRSRAEIAEAVLAAAEGPGDTSIDEMTDAGIEHMLEVTDWQSHGFMHRELAVIRDLTPGSLRFAARRIAIRANRQGFRNLSTSALAVLRWHRSVLQMAVTFRPPRPHDRQPVPAATSRPRRSATSGRPAGRSRQRRARAPNGSDDSDPEPPRRGRGRPPVARHDGPGDLTSLVDVDVAERAAAAWRIIAANPRLYDAYDRLELLLAALCPRTPAEPPTLGPLEVRAA